MSIHTKCLLSNAFCLVLCAAIGISGHPWLALAPLLGLSWAEKDGP
jgi:hypothetical protein